MYEVQITMYNDSSLLIPIIDCGGFYENYTSCISSDGCISSNRNILFRNGYRYY